MCSAQARCDLLQSERVFSIAKHGWFESGFPCKGRSRTLYFTFTFRFCKKSKLDECI